MKYLIIGGNGYLGSKVVHMLVEAGESVICTIRNGSDLSRLQDVIDNIIIIPALIENISKAIIKYNTDWIINLACNYGRGTVLYDGVIESNIEFPLRILNTAVEHGVKNILTIGTGLPDELNMYSFTKKMFSEFGRFYVEKHNINFINMKLEMFYGADEPTNRFIPECIYKMINNETVELTIGSQHRDIISVYDVVGAIFHVLHSDLSGFWLIPVGTGEAPTIRELMEYIHKYLNSKSDLIFGAIPMRKFEPNCCSDTSILNNIGYHCKYRWKQGIRLMIEEMKSMNDE